MNDYVTNGNILNQAIREHDKALEDYMRNRFREWCKEYKESVYSNSAMRRWKAKRFEE